MKYLLIFLFMLSLFSCSGKKQGGSDTGFDINIGMSASGVSNLQGGVTLHAQPVDATSEDYFTDLDANFQALIPLGSYNIVMVGFDGPEPWSGTAYCGSALVLLDQPEIDVDITLRSANCLLPLYASLIDSKGGSLVAKWDQANWDEVTWQ